MGSSLIEEALGHPAKIRVLRTLHKPGSGYMSLNQLAKVTSLNVMTLSRALKALQELGLASYVQAGASQLWRLSEGYGANMICHVLDAMENVPSLVDQIKDLVATSPIPPDVNKIVLFGSVARGDYQPGSDVDLLILWSKFSYLNEFTLSDLGQAISKRLWMTPSFLHKTSSEFKKMTPKLRKNIQEGIILYEKNQDQRGSRG